MSYEKQTWETGDVVTADKLNHMEDGIESAASGGILAVNLIYPNEGEGEASYLDKTWQEIHNATYCFCKDTYTNDDTQVMESYIPLFGISHTTEATPSYTVAFGSSQDNIMLFGSDSSDGVLTFYENNGDNNDDGGNDNSGGDSGSGDDGGK